MKTLTFSAATWISGSVSEDAEHHCTAQKTQGKVGWAGCELTGGVSGDAPGHLLF